MNFPPPDENHFSNCFSRCSKIWVEDKGHLSTLFILSTITSLFIFNFLIGNEVEKDCNNNNVTVIIGCPPPPPHHLASFRFDSFDLIRHIVIRISSEETNHKFILVIIIKF